MEEFLAGYETPVVSEKPATLYDDNYFVWVEANLRDENYAKIECAPE